MNPNPIFGRLYHLSGARLMLAIALWPLCYGAQSSELTITENWTADTKAKIVGGVQTDKQKLYVGGEDGIARAYNKEDGTLVWKRKVASGIGSRLAVDEMRVYFHTRDGTVHALSQASGKPLWRFSSDGDRQWDYWDYYLSTPSVDDRQVYFGSGDHHIYALNKRTGELRWRHKAGNIVHGEPLISGEKVIVGGFEGRMLALDRSSGHLLWSFKTVGTSYFRNGEIAGSATARDGVIYFGSRDYNLYALLAETGTGAWNDRTPSWIVGKPLIVGDAVVVANSDGAGVFAYDRKTGTEKWRSKTSYNMFAGAVAVGSNHLALGSLDGRITILNQADGTMAARYETQASSQERHRFFDADGKVIYDGVRSMEDLMALYDRQLAELGGIAGDMAAEGSVIYYAAANGVIASITLSEP